MPKGSINLSTITHYVKELDIMSTSGRILVIDDEFSTRQIVSEILREYDLHCFLAADGESGLEFFKKYRTSIRLILLDLAMPGIGGEETCRKLLEIDPFAKIVIFTGYAEEDVATNLLGLKLAGFVQKPCRWQSMTAMILRLVQSPNYPSGALGSA